MPRKRTSRRFDGRTARNLQGAQYEMDYAYNASSALHFVDAANIAWVTRGGGQHRALRRADGRPHGADDTAFPRTHGRAHGHAHGPAHDATESAADTVPDGHVPELGDAQAARRTACVARPARKPSTARPHETFYNEHMEKDFNPAEPDQCLMCDHGFKCVETGGDGQKDGDGAQRGDGRLRVRGREHVRLVEVGLPLRPEQD